MFASLARVLYLEEYNRYILQLSKFAWELSTLHYSTALKSQATNTAFLARRASVLQFLYKTTRTIRAHLLNILKSSVRNAHARAQVTVPRTGCNIRYIDN